MNIPVATMATTFESLYLGVKTWKRGTANVSDIVVVSKCGPGRGPTDDGACKNEWDGIMTAEDGTRVKVACWDWHGSSYRNNPFVGVWCDNPAYLYEWIQYLQA
jgi:hypothetical protein